MEVGGREPDVRVGSRGRITQAPCLIKMIDQIL